MRYYLLVNEKVLIFSKEESIILGQARAAFQNAKDGDSVRVIYNEEIVWGPYTVGKHTLEELK